MNAEEAVDCSLTVCNHNHINALQIEKLLALNIKKMRTNSNQLTYVTTFYVFLFWSFCSVCTVMMELVYFGTGAPVQKPHQHDQLEEWNTVSKLYYTVPYRIWIWNREFCIRKYKYAVQCNSYVEPRLYDNIHQNWQSNRLFSVLCVWKSQWTRFR